MFVCLFVCEMPNLEIKIRILNHSKELRTWVAMVWKIYLVTPSERVAPILASSLPPSFLPSFLEV